MKIKVQSNNNKNQYHEWRINEKAAVMGYKFSRVDDGSASTRISDISAKS